MPPARDLLSIRLANHKLAGSSFRTAADVVAWMGAMQAQEYGPAKWGIGQRAIGLTDAAIEREFDAGAILRTHVLRPTWHFVTPRDIRWMLALTAPHVSRRMAPYNRQLALDARLFARSHDVIARALEGGRTLTRMELADALQRAGIATAHRVHHLMLQAELDQVVCSGPRRGTRSTYALFADRVPEGPERPRDEALATLAGRYIASHGPALTRDFAWWSGLPMAEARRGLEAAALREVSIDDVKYWIRRGLTPVLRRRRGAYLLPIYDEYLIAYKDRGAAIDPRTRSRDRSTRDDFGHYLIVNGQFAGTWRWIGRQGAITLRLTPYRRLTSTEVGLLQAAGRRLGAFIAAPVTVVASPA
jgi:hypothetical protein